MGGEKKNEYKIEWNIIVIKDNDLDTFPHCFVLKFYLINHRNYKISTSYEIHFRNPLFLSDFDIQEFKHFFPLIKRE